MAPWNGPNYVKEREVEHPEDGEDDAVALVARDHGDEREQSAAEADEVHAGLHVEPDARQQSQQRRLTSDEVTKRLRLFVSIHTTSRRSTTGNPGR